MIVERTQEGKAIARQRDDFREGRKPYDKTRIDTALALLEHIHTIKLLRRQALVKVRLSEP